MSQWSIRIIKYLCPLFFIQVRIKDKNGTSTARALEVRMMQNKRLCPESVQSDNSESQLGQKQKKKLKLVLLNFLKVDTVYEACNIHIELLFYKRL